MTHSNGHNNQNNNNTGITSGNNNNTTGAPPYNGYASSSRSNSAHGDLNNNNSIHNNNNHGTHVSNGNHHHLGSVESDVSVHHEGLHSFNNNNNNNNNNNAGGGHNATCNVSTLDALSLIVESINPQTAALLGSGDAADVNAVTPLNHNNNNNNNTSPYGESPGGVSYAVGAAMGVVDERAAGNSAEKTGGGGGGVVSPALSSSTKTEGMLAMGMNVETALDGAEESRRPEMKATTDTKPIMMSA